MTANPSTLLKVPAYRRAMPHRHKLLLLVAVEVMVLGFALAAYFPIRRAGIVVETTVTPNHVVT